LTKLYTLNLKHVRHAVGKTTHQEKKLCRGQDFAFVL